MKSIIIAALLLPVLLLGSSAHSIADDDPFAWQWYQLDEQNELQVNLFVFYRSTCPHCPKALAFANELRDQVQNGTIDQYLTNSSGNDALETIDALERMQLGAVADILRRSLELLPGGWCKDQEERCRRVAMIPDRWNALRSLTEEYLAQYSIGYGRVTGVAYDAYVDLGLLTDTPQT